MRHRFPRAPRARTVLLAAGLGAAVVAAPFGHPDVTADPAQSAGRVDEPGHRTITFPVPTGAVYGNDWHNPRSGGRVHLGNDLFSPKHTPLVAVADGKISFLRVEDAGLSGRMITVKDDEGWSYRYIHLNNDTPGTDDGAAAGGHTLFPGIEVGVKVKQGQPIAFNGDSGNAEGGVAHLHFEILTPEGQNINPFASLQLSQGKRVGNLCAFDSNPKAQPTRGSGPGYRALDAVGGVFTFGDLGYFGSVPQLVNEGLVPVGVQAVGLESTPSGAGYWLIDARGGVFTFGDAGFFGSVPQLQAAGLVAGPIRVVAIESRPSGKGYWLIDEFGGVFAFGDAGYFGSVPELRAASLVPGGTRVVAIESTPTGKGYWLVDVHGGVFAFGDARYFGSVPELRGAGLIGAATFDVVGMALSKSGNGYWLLDKKGGLYAFGDAGFFGSMLGTGLCRWADAVGIAPSASGNGYWIQLADGRLFSFGDARFLGGVDGAAPGARAVSISSAA